MPTPDLSEMLAYRMLGPYRGGRVMAVAGHPRARRTFFFGSSSGGVWRTDDAGAFWRPVSDGSFRRGSVGALAISDSDPHIIYAGLGECGMRVNVTHGDGVWRSDDGGDTWRHLGLAATHNIARVRVHPRDPQTVYVAAFGHRFGPNPERGVFRSRDGGRSWDLALYAGERAGAIDLWLDPGRPRTLYAATWESLLQPWGRTSRGPGSGLYRSDDGGDTWRALHEAPGFPSGPLGRIGVCASPAHPERVWALVDAEQGGVYRSDDGGRRWTWLTAERNFLVRAWYFTHLVPDPQDPDTLYVVNRKLWKSVDGGRSYRQMNSPYVDNHDLWLDPRDPSRMALGNDGGAAVSLDGGDSWSAITNQPTAEIYRLAADSGFPYRVYGSQQDNSTISIPHRSDLGPIGRQTWYDVGGGESGWIAARPDDPEIVFASDLPGLGVTRYDHRTRQIREVAPWLDPEGRVGDGGQVRYHWSTPVVVSEHPPHALYVAGNRVFRSEDEGASWSAISPDLTRDDRERLWRAGGSPSGEHSVANDYCTIHCLAESPLVPGVLWAGSDDGLLHVTRDGGASWEDVTPPGLPAWAEVWVEPSPHDPLGAYVSATAHQTDDFRPYLWRTADGGQSWRGITRGLPEDEFVRVVRADPQRPGLLFVGTEAGIFWSRDDGESWEALQLNLPRAAVYDLLVKDGDLLVATHGRGMWVLDDLTPLRQLGEVDPAAPAWLFAPRPTVRVTRQVYRLDSLIALYEPFVAPNPPAGVVASFLLREAPDGPVTVELVDPEGRVVSAVGPPPPAPPPAPVGPLDYVLVGGVATLAGAVAGEPQPGVTWGPRTLPPEGEQAAPQRPGLFRVVLDLRYPPAVLPPGVRGGPLPPLAAPGVYTVRLRVGARVWERPAEILPDPRVGAPPEAYGEQLALMRRIHAAAARIAEATLAARALRAAREPEDGERAARLDAIEAALVQPALSERSGELAGTEVRLGLLHAFAGLAYAVARSDHAPTRQSYALCADLEARLAALEQAIAGS